MTEAEWLACAEPKPMLEFLGGRMSDRKFRLFAVGCCRPFWPLLTQQCSRDAFLVAERFADGDADRQELGVARRAMQAGFRNKHREEIRKGALTETGDPHQADARAGAWAGPWDTAKDLLRAKAQDAAFLASWAAIVTWTFSALKDRPTIKAAECGRQAVLLRDLVDNPFRQSAPINGACLEWNDGAVRKVAQTIYAEHAFAYLPILADALEEAGCDNADILAHCRSGSEHVRGCWVVDLLLNKK